MTIAHSDSSSNFLAPATTPDKVAVEGLEEKWQLRWQDEGTYKFNRNVPREQVYSIDTPANSVWFAARWPRF